MRVIGIRENPEYTEKAVQYIYSKWGNVNNSLTYRDCIEHSVNVDSQLPRWYLLEDNDGSIIGCAGLLINDYISRMDLYPWFSSLYVEESQRGRALGGVLIQHVINDAKKAGFNRIYLATDFKNYYEKFGFEYIGMGYHPWGTSSRIYGRDI